MSAASRGICTTCCSTASTGVRLNGRGQAYLNDPERRDFDAWFAYTGETAAPRPVTRREDTLFEETLYEEDLHPVCSPALLAARDRPGTPADLHDGWPLLCEFGWDPP